MEEFPLGTENLVAACVCVCVGALNQVDDTAGDSRFAHISALHFREQILFSFVFLFLLFLVFVAFIFEVAVERGYCYRENETLCSLANEKATRHSL